MDPVTAKRAKVGLDVKSADYLKFKNIVMTIKLVLAYQWVSRFYVLMEMIARQ